MHIDERLLKILETHKGETADVNFIISLIKTIAKEYETEQLRIGGVSITLPPDENIINAMKLLAEIDYENEWVWGHDTDLGKPKDVIEAFKNELLGN